MKALIVTINDGKNFNFGNKLQNFAVSEVLKKFKIDSETLNFEISSSYTMKRKAKEILMKLTAYKAARSANAKFYWKYDVKRNKRFREFDKQYLKQHNDLTLKNSSDYDYYVVGSDQVWNPEFFKYHKMKKYAYLLTFCDDRKKVCFSPSFGVSDISDEWKPWFRKYLSKIPNISVREKDSVKIVSELTGKNAEVLIDPSLMLSCEEWQKLAVKPQKVNTSKKYLLTYFLGEVSEECKAFISKIAKDNDLQILNMLDHKQPELYLSGPSEFLYLILHSELVMTDSFHACVFSFIFYKPFIVYNRKCEYSDMSSRIDTLLSKFCLTDRKIDNISENNDIFNVNYEKGYEILKDERKKVIGFLTKSLNLKSK